MANESLFPYKTLPIRLEYKDDHRGTVICFFQCIEHLDKHIERYKINRKKSLIMEADEKSTELSQTNQNEMVSRDTEISAGSADTVRKRPKILDAAGDSSTTHKPRKSK